MAAPPCCVLRVLCALHAGLAFTWVGLEHLALYLNKRFPKQGAWVRGMMARFDRFNYKDKRVSVMRKFNSSRWTRSARCALYLA